MRVDLDNMKDEISEIKMMLKNSLMEYDELILTGNMLNFKQLKEKCLENHQDTRSLKT